MLDLQVANLVGNKENLPHVLHPQSKRSTPHLNQMLPKTRKGMWIDEMLEVVMDVVERRTHSVKRANKSWNIPMSSIVDHLNGKSRFKKMGLRGVLIEKEDVTVIKWTLNLQECGFSISLE